MSTPSRTVGTTNLTAEQQDYYVKRFGIRYLVVQQQPTVPNRKARRRWKRGRS